MHGFNGTLEINTAGAPTLDEIESAGPTDLDREILEQALGSQFQIVRTLGRGGMGSVYLARDLVLHRVVAIKVLRWDLVASEEERDRFRREARTSAQLSHASIVPLHAYGETSELMYMVMRYVRGESLAQRLRRVKRLSPMETRRILCDVADALEYAHRQGVVHRDLKPENILLDEESGTAMLADFGVAVRPSFEPAPGDLRRSFGTPHFMSPEQAAGELDIDGRSDVYALGVLGYLMLSGTLPFDGDSLKEIAAKHLAALHVPLQEAAPDAPRSLVDAIERSIRREPSQRWRHARDLKAVLAPEISPLRRWWRRLRASRMPARWVKVQKSVLAATSL